MMKKARVNVFFAVVFSLFLSVNVFGVVWGNDSDGGYNGGGGRIAAGESIRELVIRGGGFFLDAYTEIFSFSARIEWAELNGVDYLELGEIIDRAVLAMTGACDTYDRLKQTADVTPYNTVVITKLIAFDYPAFQEQHGLNPEIFALLTGFLRDGDIRGMYGYMSSQLDGLSGLLNPLQSSVHGGVTPAIGDVWDINRTASRLLLFGQYVAMVFHAVNESV